MVEPLTRLSHRLRWESNGEWAIQPQFPDPTRSPVFGYSICMPYRLSRAAVLRSLALASWLIPCVAFQADTPYKYYLTGSAAHVQTRTTPGFALVGGGKDVDSVTRWFLQRSGGGDVVVLRASGSDGYNPYMMGLAKIDSVESLVVATPEAARDPFVADRIRKAEALFIAGGDQWNYVRVWNHTPLSEAIQYLIDKGVPRELPIARPLWKSLLRRNPSLRPRRHHHAESPDKFHSPRHDQQIGGQHEGGNGVSCTPPKGRARLGDSMPAHRTTQGLLGHRLRPHRGLAVSRPVSHLLLWQKRSWWNPLRWSRYQPRTMAKMCPG